MNDREAKSRSIFRWVTANLPIIGLSASIVAAVSMVALTLFRQPTTFEAGLFQVFILLTGLWGSYILGKNSALDAARELIRPHARSAFRRVLNLYDSLFRLSVRLEKLKEGNPDQRLDLVQALVDEQYTTGRDALEDWRDIIPQDVAEIERRYTQSDRSN